ncbi:hypothetical protein BKA93DRAFT_749986 [Sparassis latifolia]
MGLQAKASKLNGLADTSAKQGYTPGNFELYPYPYPPRVHTLHQGDTLQGYKGLKVHTPTLTLQYPYLLPLRIVISMSVNRVNWLRAKAQDTRYKEEVPKTVLWFERKQHEWQTREMEADLKEAWCQASAEQGYTPGYFELYLYSYPPRVHTLHQG